MRGSARVRVLSVSLSPVISLLSPPFSSTLAGVALDCVFGACVGVKRARALPRLCPAHTQSARIHTSAHRQIAQTHSCNGTCVMSALRRDLGNNNLTSLPTLLLDHIIALQQL